MAKYQDIAAQMRHRIKDGQWEVGSQLPGISALEEQWGVSLSTVRAAQQLLVEEGMLRTAQGSGAFVTSTESRLEVNVEDQLTAARSAIDKAAAAIGAQRIGTVTINLREDDVRSVLSIALEEFADRQRFKAADETDGEMVETRRRRTAVAERLLAAIEKE